MDDDKPYSKEEWFRKRESSVTGTYSYAQVCADPRVDATVSALEEVTIALDMMTPAPGFPKCDSRCSSNSHAYDEDNRRDCGMEEIRIRALGARAVLEKMK